MDEWSIIEVELTARDLTALDAWIGRHHQPRPTRGEAVREILAGTLGSDGHSTIVPSRFTGRDIV
jgi:hypothetical protein